MSRKTAIVEEFDDDTDLPLPNQPLPHTGTHGPLLQEINNSDDEGDLEPSQRAGPASPSSQSTFRSQARGGGDGALPKNTVTDITPYKSWACIYPIYIDAKRPYGTGQRRVERAKGVWWPLSKDIADAASRLGLGALHEVNKSHPRDWENPGRVRIQWKKDGELVNPAIKTKKQMLEMISLQIQLLKPDNVPKPPYTLASREPPTEKGNNAPALSATKGKQSSSSKAKSSSTPSHINLINGRRLPVPPEPHPPLGNRVSAYSPALVSGVLIEAVKAGMSATETNALPGAPAPGSGVQKGKRKVVRVRGG